MTEPTSAARILIQVTQGHLPATDADIGLAGRDYRVTFVTRILNAVILVR